MTFEPEHNYGDLVTLKSDKMITYTITGYALYPSLIMYECSNVDGKTMRHGLEIERKIKSQKIGLHKD